MDFEYRAFPSAASVIRLLLSTSVTVCCALAFCARAQAGAPEYSVTILNQLPGGSGSETFAINASGQVAGDAAPTSVQSQRDAVIWTGTSPTNLGTLGGISSYGYAINASGQVAGWSYAPGSNSYAVVWTGTTPTILPYTQGAATYAYGINAAGQVAGVSYLGGINTAVVWNGATATYLSTLGGPNGYAYGINASGQVAGASEYNAFGASRPPCGRDRPPPLSAVWAD
jgi:uncharacterized membrane protein